MLKAVWNSIKGSRSHLTKRFGNFSRAQNLSTNTRTGTWETISFRGCQVASFVPLELPPRLDLLHRNPVINTTLLEAVQEAEGNLRDLNDKAQRLPDSLISGFVKKEAVMSSQIELNTKSLVEFIRTECGYTVPENEDEVNQIFSYMEAVQLGMRLAQGSPITADILEQVHKVAMANRMKERFDVTPGKIRTTQAAVGQLISPFSRNFFPPPPKHVRRLVDNLLDYINSPGKDDMPFLVRLGVAHAQFETIHPFMEGSGQVGRQLLMLRLLHSGTLERFTLYPSYAFKVCRWLYFNCLHDTRTNGRWENWLHFFIGALSHTAIDAIELTTDLLSLHDHNLMLLRGYYDMDRARKMLDLVYRIPLVHKHIVALLFNEDYSLAAEMLDTFTRIGILEITRDTHNNTWYHNKALIDELNKERHIASYATMMSNFLQIPANKGTLEINSTINFVSLNGAH